MTSTFHGLEVAKRGMYAQQSALYTTGHNIANANTEGYTRQRVNFEQTEAFPSVSRERPEIPGQMGTGVKAGSIQRVRESFLDVQYRGENNKLGYWETRADALQKMEEIMNEPSDTGLSKTLDRFWQSLQDLAVNPTNAGARSVVRQRGIAVAETFNYLSTSLSTIQNDLRNEIDISVKEINSLANQLTNINKQISEIEPNGYLPNDLYDERDRLIDKLSSMTNIQVEYHKSGGNALPISEGTASIKIIGENGNSLATLVDGDRLRSSEMYVVEGNNGLIEHINIGGDSVSVDEFTSIGKLRGLIESHGTLYPNMLNSLDEMAFEFASEFNKVHDAGWSTARMNAAVDPGGSGDFFDIGNTSADAAALIKISANIDTIDNIAASTNGAAGDGSNAIKLAEVKNGNFVIDGKTTSFQDYYEGVIGGMAVKSQEAIRMTSNSQTLKDSVEERRMSVSAVSLDEEMTNMIQFQHAYNASARMITMQDELLDRIINNMGLVGR